MTGPVEVARQITGHKSARTKRLYARGNEVSVDEVEELSYNRGHGVSTQWRTAMQIVDELWSGAPGLSFRRRCSGPEDVLIEWFLEQELVRVPPGHRVTVFREPRLASGFPDLVIVLWKERVAKQWSPARASLLPCDLRLMHLLTSSGPQTEEAIETIFPDWERPLARLEEAGMVRMCEEQWEHHSLDIVFAATQIIAVEAKMKEWRSALAQAHLNTWFASESCVLVPRVPRNSTLLQDARELGVTVFAQEQATCVLYRSLCGTPRSYVSWLFNDWAWRAAEHQAASR
jgi:hypothetical protein